ncbi:MAG: hypothetical protein HOC77_14090 [Chloroflexi bacterium]|nr:hypothetical protein [Chloroflexota bacterium]MBT4074005.1 hypothetical protein [Chloroflexota bacterium]MBT4516207.1 hypothetical protein [Chloroflexota bacterium]MBT6682068.1 hypothetical protein [Chloroflexota bacterium]
METLLIVLGAAAALSGLAWLGYVGSVMTGSKGNALIGGLSSVVVGVAVVVLGTSVSDDGDSFQEVPSDGSGFATATPEVELTATPVVAPEELYRQEANELATRAGSDLARIIELMRSPNSESPIWVSDLRQTSEGFARYAARARDLIPTEGQTEIQEKLVNVMEDLKTAGQQVNDSFDALGLQNVAAAQDAIVEALATLRSASDVIVDIRIQTAENPA